MAPMPTRKPRVPLTFSEEELQELEAIYATLQRRGRISWRTTMNQWLAQLCVKAARQAGDT